MQRANDCVMLHSLIDHALNVLGESSKRALLFHMEGHYGISFDSQNCSNLEEIEAALRKFVGNGADVILEPVKRQLNVMSKL